MYYIMSEPHGNEEAYFDMKEKINFGDKDELYILGDVLGGDPSHPEKCLRILDDIMQNRNIHLVIGDFECAYVQYEWHENDECKEYKRMLAGMYGGTRFLKYMDTLPKQLKKKYLDYLIQCDVSEVLEIGERVFYLVHGSPAVCIGNDMGTWQRNVVDTPLDLEKQYKNEVLCDSAIKDKSRFDYDKVIIVAGHKSTMSYEMQKPLFHNHAQIIFTNNCFLIHCGCYEKDACVVDTLTCLAIDESGDKVTIHYRHK